MFIHYHSTITMIKLHAGSITSVRSHMFSRLNIVDWINANGPPKDVK